MKFPRFASFLFAALLVVLAENDVSAQWKNIAPNLIVRLPSLWGAIGYNNGTIIAAIPGSPICLSANDGKTWQLIPAPYAADDEPRDVDLYDKNNGIIVTYKSGLFITHDGGLTWTQTSLTTPLTAAKFIGSAKDIIVAAAFGHQLISHDGGITWNQLLSSGSSGQNDVQVRKLDHSIHTFETGGVSSGGNFGHINSTTDTGATWHLSSGTFYADSYTLALDPCIDSLVYVINEGNFFPGDDGFGHIFYSHDNGKSFTAVNPQDMNYYCGSLITAPGGTLYLQTQTTDGILRSTDHGVSWKSIGGPSGYSDCRFVCCKNDNTVFAIDKNGNIWETINSGGDSLAFIPTNGLLSTSPNILFDKDTLHCSVDSVTREIIFTSSGCIAPKVTGWSIIGTDSLSYSATNFTSNSLNIKFNPKTLGDHKALLVIHLSNGSFDTVILKGYNINAPFQYSFAPQSFFSGDTLSLCDPQIQNSGILKTSGCLPKIISQTITGLGANDYTIIKALSDSLVSEDSVIIGFKPKAIGNRDAVYEIIFSDSLKISLPLQGSGKDIPFIFSYDPPSLFTTDSLYLCSSAAENKISISVSGCKIPKVISQTISGQASSDYFVIRNTKDSIDQSDSAIIEFKPLAGGLRTAIFILTFGDGSIISIPLQGFGIAAHQLTLTTSDQNTNMIGGTVNVPITINGLDHTEDVDLVVHYNNELTYRNSFSQSNIQLDIPGEQWSGRSKLHITQAKPNTILGYARFDIFNDSLTKSQVTFDSLTVLTAVAPCQYILPTSVTSTITPPFGCGIDIISRFIHGGIAPQLSIIPNPTSGDISITSTGDLGEATIAVYDILGNIRVKNTSTFLKNSCVKLALPVENGDYNIRLKSLDKIYNLRVIVNR